MSGANKVICVAGTNQCAIDALSFLIKKFKKKFKILALPDKNDNGIDYWQLSFKKFAKKNSITITNLKNIYTIKNLYLFSLEYRDILRVNKFKSKNLFNIHFSLLPKYRGCHTNFLQVFYGEKKTGVSLHKIDKGIDTGDIIDKITFPIGLNDTAYQNYKKLMRYAFLIFKKNFEKILNGKVKLKKQNYKRGSYYSRNSVNYKEMIFIKHINHDIKTHNKIRSLIFPPFQLPIYKGRRIIKSLYKNNKIKLKYL